MKKLLIILMCMMLIGCETNETPTENESQQGHSTITNETVINDEDILTEDDTKEETESEPIVREVIVGVDTLNVRDKVGADSTIITQVNRGDVLVVTGETHDVNNNMWLKVSVEEEIGYIAAWFTIEEAEDRTKRVYNLNYELLGIIDGRDLYGFEAIDVYDYSDGQLCSGFKVTYNEEEAFVFTKQVYNNTITDVGETIQFIYNNELQFLESKDMKRIEFEDKGNDFLLVTMIDEKFVPQITYIVGEEQTTVVNSAYSLDEKTGFLVHIKANDENTSYDLIIENLMTNTVEYKEIIDTPLAAIEFVDLHYVLTEFTGAIGTLEKMGDNWFLSAPEPIVKGTTLYQKKENLFLKVGMYESHLVKDLTSTNMYMFEDGELYEWMMLTINQIELYMKLKIEMDQPINIESKQVTFSVNDETIVVSNGKYREIKFTDLAGFDHLKVITLNNNEEPFYANPKQTHYYVLDKTTNALIDLGNVMSVSRSGAMVLSAVIEDDGYKIRGMKVHELSDLSVLYTFEDFILNHDALDMIKDIWTMNDTLSLDKVLKTQSDWQDVSTSYEQVKLTINPRTGTVESDSVKAVGVDVETTFYANLLDKKISSVHTINSTSLDFTRTLAVNEGQILIWFKHPEHGYTYRYAVENEQLVFKTDYPITLVDENNNETIFDNFTKTTKVEKTLENNFIIVKEFDMYGDVFTTLVHKDKGFKVETDIAGRYEFSPGGDYVFTESSLPGYYHFVFCITNLQTGLKEIDFRVTESKTTMDDNIVLEKLSWASDDQINLLYSNDADDEYYVEKMLKRIDGKWLLKDRE